MKINWTVLGVLLFILLILLASFDARSDQSTISLGHTVFNSSATIGEYSYERNNWDFGLSLIGSGDTKKGYKDDTPIASISYLVRPDWEFLGGKNYYRLGGAYVHEHPLVGNSNYRLGVGMDWDVFALEYVHYSSAGIHETNTGIDAIQLRYQISHD